MYSQNCFEAQKKDQIVCVHAVSTSWYLMRLFDLLNFRQGYLFGCGYLYIFIYMVVMNKPVYVNQQG